MNAPARGPLVVLAPCHGKEVISAPQVTLPVAATRNRIPHFAAKPRDAFGHAAKCETRRMLGYAWLTKDDDLSVGRVQPDRRG